MEQQQVPIKEGDIVFRPFLKRRVKMIVLHVYTVNSKVICSCQNIKSGDINRYYASTLKVIKE